MLTPTPPNFNCNSLPFLIKIKRRAKNDRQSAILDFISAKFVLGYPCASPYILSSYFPLISSCINITKLLKFNMAARQPF